MGCVPASEPNTQSITYIQDDKRPTGADEGTCWVRQIRPAVIETLTKTKTKPVEGSTEPSYQTTESHRIVQEGEVNWIESVCPVVMTQEFVSSLQRALKVREAYSGDITGKLDKPTLMAIEAVQTKDGYAVDILLVQTAQKLGLVAVRL